MRIIAAGVVLSALLALSGCGLVPGLGVTSVCADYGSWDTPAEAAAQADTDAVVLATITDVDGRTTVYDDARIPTRFVTLDVDEVLSGDVPDTTIEVVSLPESCTSSDRDVDTEPDPFADRGVGAQVIVLLNEYRGQWQTITPYQGVVDPEPDGTLPSAWPTPAP